MTTGKQISHPHERSVGACAVLSGPAARKALGLTTAVAVVGTMVGVFGASPAAADPVSHTLNYSCGFQVFGHTFTHSGTVAMHADIPKSVAVGQPTPKFTISGAVRVNAADATAGRRAFMHSVEATGDAQFRVEAPEGHKDFKVLFHAAKTNIPASGGFSVKVTGVAPSTSFSKSGKAKITVGDLDGHVTVRGFITVDPHVQCKLTPGQNNVVASFDITGPRKV